MRIKLKPLHEQVMVITGATNGIGLATVHRAVEQGTRVFMIARNEHELQLLQDEMLGKGYDTAFAVADVCKESELERATEQCLATFGTIDTWVNNAGDSITSKLTGTSKDDARHLFNTNFWGVVNGCHVAMLTLRQSGGCLINIGSVFSSMALPIQGIYSASKHAVKGYTDALRRELLAEKTPISVSLITPGVIASADVVAGAVLKCAVKPIRELGVGISVLTFPTMRLFPRIQDFISSKKIMEEDQSTGDVSHVP